MFSMHTSEAQQLVAERRASSEAVAFRRHFRRFMSANAAPAAATTTRVPRSGHDLPAGRRDRCPEVSVSTLA
jgi:hypothetical protein